MNEFDRPSRGLRIVAFAIAAYLIAPLIVVVGMSFNPGNSLRFPPRGLSLRWYRNFFETDRWIDGALVSVRLGVIVAVLAVLLGYPLALLIDRMQFRGKSLLLGVTLSPLIVPSIVLGVALYLVFADLRIVATFHGLVLAHTALALPYVVVNVLASLRLVDPHLERAARSLGAGPLTAFWRVTVPLTIPGIMAGALFAFVISWDEVILAIFLTGPQTQTLPIVMWSQLRTSLDPTIAAAAALLMLVTVLGAAAGIPLVRVLRRRLGVDSAS